MKKILEAKTDNDSIFWDVSTPELEDKAYVELVAWREDNQFYFDLEERDERLPLEEFNRMKDLLKTSLNGVPQAARRFIGMRSDYEDENYFIWNLM